MPSPAPSSDDSHQRVRAYLAGDAEASAWLGVRLLLVPRAVAGLCRRFGLPLSRDEVADVAQDAIAIAVRKLDELRPNVPFDAWLRRISSYELGNALRRRRRRNPPLPDDVSDPAADAIERLERQEFVHRALEGLRAEDAAVVRLHLLDGLTMPEVAVRLGVTTNTAKGRYYRAMTQLAHTLRRDRPARSTR